MTLPNLNLISQDIVNAAHKAGKEILELWKKSIEIEYKKITDLQGLMSSLGF